MLYKNEILAEILEEWAYRVDNGMPNPNDREHIWILSEVLSDLGLVEIKDELIGNLLEAQPDKKFKNPVLNKVVKYTDKRGNEKEGIIGNLLRNPKDSPGRIAAEKMLPAEGTPQRDEINNELGVENQPNRDIEKGFSFTWNEKGGLKLTAIGVDPFTIITRFECTSLEEAEREKVRKSTNMGF